MNKNTHCNGHRVGGEYHHRTICERTNKIQRELLTFNAIQLSTCIQCAFCANVLVKPYNGRRIADYPTRRPPIQ